MVDHYGVDGVVEGGALAVGGVGTALRRTQTGFVRSYALSLVAGAILVVVALLAVNLT
jgi:NADH-quinone oxidoreductase subunit L